VLQGSSASLRPAHNNEAEERRMDSRRESDPIPSDSTAAERIHALEAHVRELTGRLDAACRRLDERERCDAVTGLVNRRAALEWLDEAWDEDRTGETPLSLLLVDVDGLALVNENFGSKAGDRALLRIARAIEGTLRTDDLAGRLGGDEFVVILPATSLEGALCVAEKLREAVAESFHAFDGGFWQASVSIGVAGRAPALETPQALLEMASRGLYAAKLAGRGRCVSAQATAA
jgi:diguanylate cyclase (GGDEF)-like protein